MVLFSFCNDSHYIAVITAWIVSVINHINTQAETDIKTLVKISVLFFYTILIIYSNKYIKTQPSILLNTACQILTSINT